MSMQLPVRVGILALTVQLLGCADPVVSYSTDVQPIFDEHCIECHDRSGEGVVAKRIRRAGLR